MPASVPSPSRRLPRVALIGVTGYAGVYLDLVRNCRERGELEVSAAVIVNPQVPEAARAAAELAGWGATIHESSEALFTREAGRIDLCLIPTGIAWHARLTVAALRAGMHVLVEKPLAGSLADIARIRAAERETGRWVAVGFQDIYADAAKALKAELLAGRLGALRSVSGFGLWPRPLAYYSRNHWAGRLRADDADVLDSPLNNAFAHFVNLALFFADTGRCSAAPFQLSRVELLRVNPIESFDTAVVRARTADGVRLWFGFSHASEENHEPEVVVEGERGRAHWSHERQLVIEVAGEATRTLPLPDTFVFRRAMMESVLLRLRQPDAWICDTALAERHSALICALHQRGAITAFPSRLVERRASPASAEGRLVVAGLGEALTRAFQLQGTLAGTGLLATPAAALAAR